LRQIYRPFLAIHFLCAHERPHGQNLSEDPVGIAFDFSDCLRGETVELLTDSADKPFIWRLLIAIERTGKPPQEFFVSSSSGGLVSSMICSAAQVAVRSSSSAIFSGVGFSA